MPLILHLDMNSYYATLEQQAYANLRGKPIGVAGKGDGERTVMVGASVEAKRLGVKSVTTTWEARASCRELVIIPANYSRYSFTSKRIFRILERFSDKVEIFSIDEAFMELGEGIGWEEAEQIAFEIKQLLKKYIGSWVTCSIGISYGKTLAKLASELQKPDGLVVIHRDNFHAIAQKVAVGDVCGIGYRITPRLNRLGIFTLAQLGSAPLDSLIKMFGQHTGTWLHRIGNGVDDNTVQAWTTLPQEKSMSHSYTLPRDIVKKDDIEAVILLLSLRLGARMRRKGLVSRFVQLGVKPSDSHFYQSHLVTNRDITSGREIFLLAKNILPNLGSVGPIRYVLVRVAELSRSKNATQSLFDYDRKQQRVEDSIEKINNRYGDLTVHLAAMTNMRRRIFDLPDGRNKRSYLPTASPFVKRMEV